MGNVVKRMRWPLYGLIIGAGIVGLLVSSQAQAQGANSMYLAPAGGTHTVGANINVAVRINTTTAVNAVQADLTYSPNLQFVSINEAGSAFAIPASGSGGNGSVTIARGNFSGVSGDQLVATVVFKVASAGTGTIQVENSSAALSATDSSNVLTARNGASYSLQAPTSPSPSSPPASSPPPPAQSKPTNSRTVIQSGGSTVAVTPNQPSEQKVELSAPASLESLSVGGGNREIVKVEYLLDGKVISSSTTPPYKYSIDNTDYRNGTYELTSKTYYKDGEVETGKVSLVIDNPFSLKAAWLEIKHYAWLVIILLIIIGELLYLTLFKRLRKPKASPLSDSDRPVAVVGGQAPPTTPSDSPAVTAPTPRSASSSAPGVIQPAAQPDDLPVLKMSSVASPSTPAASTPEPEAPSVATAQTTTAPPVTPSVAEPAQPAEPQSAKNDEEDPTPPVSPQPPRTA